ncbi:hypothetical protein G3I43_33355 [Streptomyces anulatus]|uniref:Uncharacterized protein n=1 Tax=Streptomyces anulatus TaxID=1892 RepID=A0A6G3T286_STRAQ|nr:hypothetical protein [Streptomyces anulatus]NEB89015.1 hypothetical protein [Streptomyces anulatus]
MPPDALFDVPTPLPPVGQLLLLAGEYTRHNDSVDLGSTGQDQSIHSRSAERLASETTAAITAVVGLRLFHHADLTAALVRLRQVAYLADAASRHGPRLARELTSFAPEAVVDSAARIAAHMRRRRSGHALEPDDRLDAVQQAALHEIALGHVVSTSSLNREYLHSTGARVSLGALRAVKSHGFVERSPGSAPAAFDGGPRQDRVRLTLDGATALATVITTPSASRDAPAVTLARPAPGFATRPASSRSSAPGR